MNECAICYDDESNQEFISKWACGHKFHSNCIENWHRSCPYCRCEQLDESVIETISWQISTNPTNVLDIEIMKNTNPIHDISKKQIYLNQWKDRECISNEHTLLCCKPFGVLLICETCNTIQTFNLMH